MKVQVELCDTYKSVHKTQTITNNFIRPELHGYVVSSPSQPQPKDLSSFKLRDSWAEKTLLQKREFNGATYTFYTIPDEPLSASLKACFISINEREAQLDTHQKVESAIVKSEEQAPSKPESEAVVSGDAKPETVPNVEKLKV